MALSPKGKGNIKDVVDAEAHRKYLHQYNSDRFENYIDRCILKDSSSRPLTVFMADDLPEESVIKELRAKYLSAGWKSFEHKYASDSRGDSYCYIIMA